MKTELIENLARQEHKQWAHWTSYWISLHDRAYKSINVKINNTEPLTIWVMSIKKWKQQIKTPYNSLSEKEKESDRVWARKTIEIINKTTKFKLLRVLIGEVILLSLSIIFFVMVLYLGSFNIKIFSILILTLYLTAWFIMSVLD